MSDFYKMDPAAWDFGTASLSLEEEAAYLRIVNAIHKHKAPVPDNDRILAGLFRCSTRKARSLVNALVDAGKLIVDDGVILNNRALKDLKARGYLSNIRAEVGAKGGRARAEKAASCHNSQPFREHFATISGVEMVTNHQRTDNEQDNKSLIYNNAAEAIGSPRVEKRREDSGDGSARDGSPTLREQILEAMGHHPTGVTATGKIFGTQADMAEVSRWLALPAITPENLIEEIRRVSAQKRGPPPNTFSYYTKAIQRLSGELTKEALTPTVPDPQKGQAHGSSKSTDRFHAFIGGAIGTPSVDRGEDTDPPQPLLARGRPG